MQEGVRPARGKPCHPVSCSAKETSLAKKIAPRERMVRRSNSPGGVLQEAPTIFLPRSSLVETKAFAESLELRVAVPHELMSWRRISGSAEITAEASYETHGITKLFGLRQSFF